MILLLVLAWVVIVILAFGNSDHRQRIERLERALRELNPGLNI